MAGPVVGGFAGATDMAGYGAYGASGLSGFSPGAAVPCSAQGFAGAPSAAPANGHAFPQGTGGLGDGLGFTPGSGGFSGPSGFSDPSAGAFGSLEARGPSGIWPPPLDGGVAGGGPAAPPPAPAFAGCCGCSCGGDLGPPPAPPQPPPPPPALGGCGLAGGLPDAPAPATTFNVPPGFSGVIDPTGIFTGGAAAAAAAAAAANAANNGALTALYGSGGGGCGCGGADVYGGCVAGAGGLSSFALGLGQQQQQHQQHVPSAIVGGGTATVGAAPGQQFVGLVKAFSDDKGWGHIVCEETKAIFGKDIFVMRSSLRCGRVRAGDTVRFSVTSTSRGPQASEVYSMMTGADWTSQDTTGRVFVGAIKLFSEEKGWGFIECADTMKMFGKDMFVHKREFGGSDVVNGTAVQFSVELGKDGRPEAKNLTILGGAISAAAGAGTAPGHDGYGPCSGGAAGPRTGPY